MLEEEEKREGEFRSGSEVMGDILVVRGRDRVREMSRCEVRRWADGLSSLACLCVCVTVLVLSNSNAMQQAHRTVVSLCWWPAL